MALKSQAHAPRIPSLDGLRALSIMAVLLGHLDGTAGAPEWLAHVAQVGPVDVANLGVRIFFVISGLLITTLLLSEIEQAETVHLGRFYLRRSLRIFPAYFAFIAVVGVGSALGVFRVAGPDFVHALTYTTNYQIDRSWELGHLWSLSLEEQFYLVWPATLALVGIARVRALLVVVVLGVPLVRVLLGMMFPAYRPLIGSTFETGIDAIALGCLLALERDRLWLQTRWRHAVSSYWLVPLTFALAVGCSTRFRPLLLLGIPLSNMAIVFLVERVVRLPGEWLGRLLNSRALVYVGTLSYSIYLTQQLFLNRTSTRAFAHAPLNLLLAALAALVSYYCIERPILRVRPKLEQRLLR